MSLTIFLRTTLKTVTHYSFRGLLFLAVHEDAERICRNMKPYINNILMEKQTLQRQIRSHFPANNNFGTSMAGAQLLQIFFLLPGVHKSQASGCHGDKISVRWRPIFVDPHNRTWFMSPFWRPEFWGGCYIFGKFEHHWSTVSTFRYLTIFRICYAQENVRINSRQEYQLSQGYS